MIVYNIISDYYKILGIDRNISQKELKKKYYKLARQYHPDVAEDKKTAEDKFKRITEAYNALSSSKKRQNLRGNVVYGFNSSPAKKQLIIDRLNSKKDFSISSFAFDLKVSNSNLLKILEKFIIIYKINGYIKNNTFCFTR